MSGSAEPAELLSLQRLRADWQQLGADGQLGRIHLALLGAYGAASRHYHCVQHLSESLGWLEQIRHALRRPADVAVALWFHDAVYELPGHDNEQRSAEWAQAELLAAAAAPEVQARIVAMILATRHPAQPPKDADTRWLLDIDLAILGAPPTRFEEYEAQIRREYGFMPPTLFETRRSEVLQGFLDRPRLYLQPFFDARLEAQARANLVRALRCGGPVEATDLSARCRCCVHPT